MISAGNHEHHWEPPTLLLPTLNFEFTVPKRFLNAHFFLNAYIGTYMIIVWNLKPISFLLRFVCLFGLLLFKQLHAVGQKPITLSSLQNAETTPERPFLPQCVHSHLLIDSYMIIASKLEFDITTPNSIQNNKLCPKVGFFVYLGCLPQMGALVHCANDSFITFIICREFSPYYFNCLFSLKKE